MLLPTPVGQGLLTFGEGDVQDGQGQKRFRRPTHRVNQLQTLFASVAEPSGNASRLIADVWGGQGKQTEMSQESLRLHYDYKNLSEEYDAKVKLDVTGTVGLFSLC